jgi:hypothetical protein
LGSRFNEAARGSDRFATNHNPLQARETAANQRAHDRMGRHSYGEGVWPTFIDRGDGMGGRLNAPRRRPLPGV